MVHITSGAAVAEMLRQWAGEPRLIVWDDPVERDRQLARLVERDSLWLWFENTPADQARLDELRDFLVREKLTRGPHFLIHLPPIFTMEQMASLAANKTRLVLPDPQ